MESTRRKKRSAFSLNKPRLLTRRPTNNDLLANDIIRDDTTPASATRQHGVLAFATQDDTLLWPKDAPIPYTIDRWFGKYAQVRSWKCVLRWRGCRLNCQLYYMQVFIYFNWRLGCGYKVRMWKSVVNNEGYWKWEYMIKVLRAWVYPCNVSIQLHA